MKILFLFCLQWLKRCHSFYSALEIPVPGQFMADWFPSYYLKELLMKHRLLVPPALFLILVFAAPPAIWGQATVIRNITGISLTDEFNLGHGAFIPPDQGSAVGPNQYVQFVNDTYAIYNKNGTTAVAPTPISTFWANAGVAGVGTNFSDPRLVYDQASQRWFAAGISVSSNNNLFYLAVSQTSDPLGAWKGTSFRANTINNNFADYPTIAVDKNGFYIASNNFANGMSFDGLSLTTIPKADLLNPSGPVVANRTHTENIVGGGTPGTTPFTFAPVSDFNGRNHGVILATDGFTPANVLHRYNVLNPGSNPSILGPDTPIGTPSYANNANAHQPDGTANLSGGGFRIGQNNVYQVGNTIWAANSVLNGGFDAIRWFKIDEPTNTLLQSGLITLAHHDLIYPAIAANGVGDVVIGFTASGDNTTADFPGSWYVAGTTTGGVTTFGSVNEILNGVTNYHIVGGGRNRWGDFSAISVDPNDPFTFWIAEEVAVFPLFGSSARWGTEITEISFPVPEPSTLVLAGLAFAGMVGYGWSRRRRLSA